MFAFFFFLALTVCFVSPKKKFQKLYIVPGANQSNIPFSRINHNKYMVTDNKAYISESYNLVVDFLFVSS